MKCSLVIAGFVVVAALSVSAQGRGISGLAGGASGTLNIANAPALDAPTAAPDATPVPALVPPPPAPEPTTLALAGLSG